MMLTTNRTHAMADHSSKRTSTARGKSAGQTCQPDCLVQLFERTKRDQVGRIDAERAFGCEWNRVKSIIKATRGQTIQQYVASHGLPFSHTYANGCGRLAANFQAFEAAHSWYEAEGIINGWRTKRTSGWEYALEVIGLHKSSVSGGSPTRTATVHSKNSAGGGAKVRTLERELDESANAGMTLLLELEVVCWLYSKTREGAGYTNLVLNEARAAVKLPEGATFTARAAASGVP